MRVAWVAMVVAIPMVGQPPGVRQNGVVNAASQIPPTLAGGAIARGGLFTVYGIRLGGSGQTSVTVSGVAATVVSASATRIEAVMPTTVPIGAGALVVSVKGLASKAYGIQVAQSNPGLFSRNGEGWGPGLVVNVEASGKREANSFAHPAQRREQISLMATGVGGAANVRMMIGNSPAVGQVSRAGLPAGREAITVRVPANAATGCFVPVYVLAAPNRASNVVTVAISSGKGTCDAGPVPLAASENFGVAAFSRTRLKARTANHADAVVDDARISFSRAGERPSLSPLRLMPPPGTCTAYTSSFQSEVDLSSSISTIIGSDGRDLDAGRELTLTRRDQVRTIARGLLDLSDYRMRLGSSGGGEERKPRPPFLESGDYVLEGAGGQDVGKLRVAFAFPPAFVWSDRDQTAVVDRARGVTLHWTGVAKGQMMFVVARNVDQITTAIGMCLCVPETGAGQFTVPPALLANIPISHELAGVPFDKLLVGTLPAKIATFEAPGLKNGFVVPFYVSGRIVSYR